MTAIIAAIAESLSQAAQLVMLWGKSDALTEQEIEEEIARIRKVAKYDTQAELDLF